MDWNQLKTILWLRWRISRNQWSRSGRFSAIITMILIFAGLAVSVIGGITGVLIGALAMAKAEPVSMLFIWDIISVVFLFIWMIGLISEIQRSETIDIGRMLHLPVFLRDIFIINYLASHLTFSVILFLPAMLGLSVGMVLGGRFLMILMLPLVLGFMFMITAWTYCLRGWLVTLMVNKRRRRAIIAGITFGFILLSQLPNLLGSIFHDREPRRSRRPDIVKSIESDKQTETPRDGNDELKIPPELLNFHRYFPFLWVGNGAMTLAQGSALPAALCAAGAFAIGGLGLRRAYRSTIRFYQGQTASKAPVRKPKAEKIAAKKSSFLEKQLPGISNEASAMGLACFRSILRAPEIKMLLATNLMMYLFVGGSILFRRSINISDTFKPFIATGIVVITFFVMSQLMFNMFGADRIGFRTLVLTPARREHILLGKNLAYLPIACLEGLILLIFVKFAGRIPVMIILAAVIQLIAAFFLMSIAGNLVSVFVPYRIAPGSMKRTKTSGSTTLLTFVAHFMAPTIMMPIFIVPAFGWLLTKFFGFPAGLAHIFLAALLLILIVFLYKRSLPAIGKLLQQQEKKILEVVTREIE